MTTIAMAAGMAPSALGLGYGGEFRSPMAIAVIGGLLVSTMLSLLFVPAVFTILDDAGRLTWRLFGRFVINESAPEEGAPKSGHPEPAAAASQHASDKPLAPIQPTPSPLERV
jgi:HAE1 family hydrophobic/amphiphilic exporter-1